MNDDCDWPKVVVRAVRPNSGSVLWIALPIEIASPEEAFDFVTRRYENFIPHEFFHMGKEEFKERINV